jgi:peptide/nickel transport system permease protein
MTRRAWWWWGGVGVLTLYVVAAVAAPWLGGYGPLETTGNYLTGPSGEHWLGTDQIGRDVWTRVVYGARLSLGVAAVAVGIALPVGTLIGLAAGTFRGWVDLVVGRVLDVMFAVPEVLLALVVVAVVGVGFGKIALAIGIVYVPIFARLARAVTLSLAGRPYVEAARALGASPWRVMGRHLLPGLVRPVVVQGTLSLAFAILAEAALSFLGLSGETDAPSWGLMLRQGKDLMEIAWWVAVFPGLAITLAVLALNVVGDGLSDWLDPSSK